ncbi:hypothetical protein J7384_05335 [Endozoicomonas sp. G2_1]|uniref:hypothetical protein n=1 Tax=Endozoicomonas sp. G2_1 TaxID=2821091 RepID=UPI001ADD46D0|nr:hypothetical protein [Endozoicomonas sp. G2_1]MBO9489780.1 hypothetical protein [Endozoicomonas sp. G2_1]
MNMGINTRVKELNTEETKLDVIALMLNVNKSAVSKMGNKTVGDTNLLKLKEFVEAAGGSFSTEITLANGDIIKI